LNTQIATFDKGIRLAIRVLLLTLFTRTPPKIAAFYLVSTLKNKVEFTNHIIVYYFNIKNVTQCHNAKSHISMP